MEGNPFHVPAKRPMPPRNAATLSALPGSKASNSPAKRRRFFNDSDEYAGEKTIEQYIYDQDYYRTSTNSVKFPHPLYSTSVAKDIRQKFNRNELLISDLYAALKAQNVRQIRTVQFRMLSKPGYPQGGDIPLLTLCIEVDCEDIDEGHTWSDAKRECAAVLDAHEIDGVEVEIIDPEKAFHPSLFAIPPEDPHIQCFESFRDDLMTFVLDKIKDAWVSMCLWKVGNVYMQSTFEVVIFVRPFSVRNWQSLSQEISSNFIQTASKGLNDIGVTFLPGACGEITKRPGASLVGRLTPHPNLGSSIGVEGEREGESGGGTFGGYFSLKKLGVQDFAPARVVLTNAHVVRPPQSSPSSVRKRYDIEGVPFDASTEDERRAMVRYPALKALNPTKENLQGLMDEAEGAQGQKGEIERLEMAILIAKGMGEATKAKSLESRLAIIRQRVAEWRQAQALCDGMPIDIGRVHFSTGHGLNSRKRVLDFALVSINDAQMTTHQNVHANNDTYKSVAMRAFQNLQLDNDLVAQFEKKVLGLSVAGLGHIEKGKWYFKSGRTTGITAGICHGTESYVNLAGYRTPYSADGQAGDFKHHEYSQELVIATPTKSQVRGLELDVNPTGGHESEAWVFNVQADFADLGDSGALLVNMENEACGLLFGTIQGSVGPYEWEKIGPPVWEDAQDVALGIQEDYLGTQPYGDVGSNHRVYGASCGLVTCMRDIMEHLKLRAGLALEG